MANRLLRQIIERLYSRSFLFPFAFVTILFLLNIVLLPRAQDILPLELSPLFSFGAMTILYALCVLEAVGFSIFVGIARVLWKKKLAMTDLRPK